VTGLLKDQLGFKGHRRYGRVGYGWPYPPVRCDIGRAAVDAFKAGNDLLIIPADLDASYRAARILDPNMAADRGEAQHRPGKRSAASRPTSTPACSAMTARSSRGCTPPASAGFGGGGVHGYRRGGTFSGGWSVFGRNAGRAAAKAAG